MTDYQETLDNHIPASSYPALCESCHNCWPCEAYSLAIQLQHLVSPSPVAETPKDQLEEMVEILTGPDFGYSQEEARCVEHYNDDNRFWGTHADRMEICGMFHHQFEGIFKDFDEFAQNFLDELLDSASDFLKIYIKHDRFNSDLFLGKLGAAYQVETVNGNKIAVFAIV